ncbi:MAG TPA: F0F1 ATP synthase subunit B [Limnochordia bacterium]|nr:F0F1 ATP synthase subunit B [Limnochordia bacterium]
MIDQNLLLAQTINFILLVFLLYKLLYKPVRNFMDQRTAEIEHQIRSAEENQKAAEALRLELERQSQESRQQARQIIDEATKRAEEVQAKLIAEAKAEARAILDRAQREVQLEKEKAWAELKQQVGELAVLLASKVINASLDDAQHSRLIAETIDQLDTLDKGHLQ